MADELVEVAFRDKVADELVEVAFEDDVAKKLVEVAVKDDVANELVEVHVADAVEDDVADEPVEVDVAKTHCVCRKPNDGNFMIQIVLARLYVKQNVMLNFQNGITKAAYWEWGRF